MLCGLPWLTSPEVNVSNAISGVCRDPVCFKGSYAFAAETRQCHIVGSRPELLSKQEAEDQPLMSIKIQDSGTR